MVKRKVHGMELYILWILIICIRQLVEEVGKQILRIVTMKNGSPNGLIKITVCLDSYLNTLEENNQANALILMMLFKKNFMKFAIVQ